VPPPPPPPPDLMPGSGAPGAAAPPAAAPPSAGANKEATAGKPESGRRKQGEPPEPGPQESNLQMPQVRSTPAPEPMRAPPPVPSMAPTAAPAAVPPAPVAMASATPQPSPAPPSIAPPPPPPALPGKGDQKRPGPVASTVVASIDFAGDATAVPPKDRPALDKVVALYRQNPGPIRVVAYAAPAAAGAGAAQLGSFHAALARAQAVAASLTAAGIPKDKVLPEAAPAASGSPAGRVEIRIEH